jgi:hypothetical protein
VAIPVIAVRGRCCEAAAKTAATSSGCREANTEGLVDFVARESQAADRIWHRKVLLALLWQIYSRRCSLQIHF